MAKRNALGKGLGALLENDGNDVSTKSEGTPNSVAMIPLSQVVANPFQPRTEFEDEALSELAESILIHGVIQPITVRKIGSEKYELISGERRTRASIIAGLEKIPGYIRLANDQEMLEMALIENIQREDLNAIEISLSYKRLLDECGLRQEELGERVGKKRSTVNNYLRLLKLPDSIQLAIQKGEISMGHARALINIEEVEVQDYICKRAVAEGLSVRKVEELVKEYQSTGVVPDGNTETTTTTTTSTSKEKASFKEFKPYRDLLKTRLDSNVEFSSTKGEQGKIIIHFDDKPHLTDILEKLRKI
ncbi:MAG: ParB/RepB/Spo0J family partition protein [Bacteroidia bacterium]|nr:ParB/RepB/Spo0J family partition protein [Bacteroidia bacterium]